MVTLEDAESNPEEYLGRDIMLTSLNDISIGTNDDFAIIFYENNLKQAIIDRLRTAQGELTLHPNYGSRLHELLGANSTDDTLVWARMFTREALLQEPRIEKILSVTAEYKEESMGEVIEISISVQPIQDLDKLNMVFSLFLTGDGTLLTEVK